MQDRRVVVTGMHAITSLGHSWEQVGPALESGQSGIRKMPEWDQIEDLSTRLAGGIHDFVKPAHWTRKQIRSMGRVAMLAVSASELALADAGLSDSEMIDNGMLGVAYGSCNGSTDAIREFNYMITGEGESKVNATTYIRLMGHTTAVNIAVFLAIHGRIVNTSTACTSGSQAIGYACEMIRSGKQTAMLAGGAEELCPSQAAIFDTLYATSLKNDSPSETPRPFDRDRDGLVIGEGACTLVLEELEHALARDATIYAEVSGYGTNCDGNHITQPDQSSMQRVMELALDDAAIEAGQIDYVSAHGTGTEQGDIAESRATAEVLGNDTLVSTLKGNLGHTLGACGAIETWAAINMMNSNRFAPTLNLDNPDPACADLDYIVSEPRQLEARIMMCNNFAFGGINTSLIITKWST